MPRKESFVRGFYAALGVAALGLLLFASWSLFRAVAAIITPFLIAIVVALLLDPVVDRVQARWARGRRLPAVLLAYLIFLVAFGGSTAYVVPLLVGQAQRLVERFTPPSYQVRRSITSGGPYTVVATRLSARSYTNTGLTNGTTYYFVVSAISPEGVVLHADEVAVTPRATGEAPAPAAAGRAQEGRAGGDATATAADPAVAAARPTPAPLTVQAQVADEQVILSWVGGPASGFEAVRSRADVWLREHRRVGPITLPPNVDDLTRRYGDQLSAAVQVAARRLADMLLGSVSRLLWVVLIPIVTFYVLADIDRLRARLLFLMPDRVRASVERAALDVGGVFGDYVRGLMLVSLAYGVVAVGLFFLLDMKAYALLLGVAAGLLFAIPFVGPLVTALLATIVSLATGHTLGHTVLVLIVVLIQNQVFDNLVVPRVIGHSVGLHPLATLFALFLGGELFGLWGMLLSVPVAASIQVILFRLFPRLAAPTPLSLLLAGGAAAERHGSGRADAAAAVVVAEAEAAPPPPPAR